MKKLLFISCLLILAACTNTPQQKAEKLVKQYLESTLNDPHSYESVSFGDIHVLRDTVISLGAGMDIINNHKDMLILHTYRAKNQFGALILKSDWFKIDSAMTKASCCFSGVK